MSDVKETVPTEQPECPCKARARRRRRIVIAIVAVAVAVGAWYYFKRYKPSIAAAAASLVE